MGKVKFDFTGEVAVITGAATGIGRCVAEEFAKAGADVAILDMNEEEGLKTQKMCEDAGAKAKFYKLDVTSDREVIEGVRDAVIADFGKVDILHSNAGVGQRHTGSVFTMPDDEWEQVYNVNVFGSVKVIRAFSEPMKERRYGRITMTASISAFIASYMAPAYGSSKSSVVFLMRALALELGDYNINVNVLNPGFIYTAIYADGGAQDIITNFKRFTEAGVKDPRKAIEIMASQSALHRMQEPIDMANMVMYLSSDGGREISGQAMNIDSGFVLH